MILYQPAVVWHGGCVPNNRGYTMYGVCGPRVDQVEAPIQVPIVSPSVQVINSTITIALAIYYVS
jgi:hypothetical protein